MILLVSTNESVEMATSAAVNLDWTTHFVDITTIAFTPSASDGQATTATNTTIVAAPAASTQRQVKFMSFRNVGASSNTVTVRKVNTGNKREMWAATLAAGEALYYTDGEGFVQVDANGNRKVLTVNVAPIPALQSSPLFSTANLTTAKTITSTNSFALYMGKAPRAYTAGQTMQIRLRVTTAAATITWCEAALAKGTPVIGGNPTLTVVGFADTSATYNSTGQKTTTITISTGQAINAGDDVWVLIGNSATTALQVRAASIADDLQTGFQASAVQRPSLIVGTGTAFTLEGATTVPAWINLIF